MAEWLRLGDYQHVSPYTDVVIVFLRTPDIGGGYWFLSNLVIYQLYYDYQP
jgi:hypothetical protein